MQFYVFRVLYRTCHENVIGSLNIAAFFGHVNAKFLATFYFLQQDHNAKFLASHGNAANIEPPRTPDHGRPLPQGVRDSSRSNGNLPDAPGYSAVRALLRI